MNSNSLRFFVSDAFPKLSVANFLYVESSINTNTNTNVKAILDLIDPEVIKHSFYLADTEFQVVLEPDYEGIAKLQDKLKFYYGTIDAWVPTQYYEELVKNVPNVQAELCTSEYPHAFVLSASEPMAKKVANWIKTIE